jgi:type III secretion protein Q
LLGQAIAFPNLKLSRVVVRNALAAGRQNWTFPGEPKGFACRPRIVPANFNDPVTIEGDLNGDAFVAHIEGSVVKAALNGIDQDIVLDDLTPETTALLLEHALDHVFSHCHEKTGRRVTLKKVSAASTPAEPDSLGLEFTLGQTGPACIAIRGSSRVYEALFEFSRVLPVDFTKIGDLMSQVSIRLATAMLSAGELETLAPGDMVVIDRSDLSGVVLVCNEYAIAPAQITGTKIRISSSFQSGRYGNLGEFIMSSPTATDSGATQPIARLADMPVKVAFELGRLDISLSELASAGEGHVFILPTPLSNGCALVAGGAIIGRGEVVKVGDQFAVRVISMAPR